jgi:hypothetical protein
MRILKETNKKKVLHIRIPKNGTHSINNILKEKKLDNWNRTNFVDKKTNVKYIFDHDPFYTLKNNNTLLDDVFIFSVSRNPYTRFFSQYKHLVNSYSVYFNRTFFDFYADVKNKKIHPIYTEPQVKWLSKKEGNTIPEKILYNDVFNVYFKYTDNLNNKTIIDKRINKFYKIENIKEFEDDFQISLQYRNVSNYSLIEYKKSFTEEIKKFIIDYYKEDFENFGYDFDFEQSIIGLKMQRKNLLCYQ